ncbi:MAG: hypothetical protein GW855_07800 [Erythrobacter sp.]|nr:hypothetical protein [Erythrobacter sp.]
MSRRLPSAEAMRIIAVKGLAPLARAYASQPRDPLNFHAGQWRKRVRQAEVEVIDNLRAEGVEIAISKEGTVRVAFENIRTTSRLGLRTALKNWETKARGDRVDGLYRKGRKP